MTFSRLSALVLPLAAALAGPAAAGPMLTGSVAYDPRTGLYTYSYALDDRSAAAPVSHIFVRVLTDSYQDGLSPAGSTAPNPYAFGTFTGQGLIGHPEFPGGTFFGWTVGGNPPPLTAGVTTGFSFTTRYAPGTGTGGPDNYYLWSTAATDRLGGLAYGVQEVGHVVAPDYTKQPPVQTPEPANLALAGVGLAGLAVGRGRRGRLGGSRLSASR